MMTKIHSSLPLQSRAWFGWCLLALSQMALADAPPDAGVLQQQLDRERKQPTPPIASPPKLVVPATPTPLEGGLTVMVNRFAFSGNTQLADEQLSEAVAGFVGRPLSFADLQAASAAVADAYLQAGWVVRTSLPQQGLDGGVVVIQIVEAMFGNARIQPGDPSVILPVSQDRLRRVVERALPPGKPISTRAIDRALLLLNETPGISVAQGSLAAGEAEGETDLQVTVVSKPPWSGDVRVDNFGSRSTGYERLSANVALASPAQMGDQLSANFMHSQGSDYGRLAYGVPLGYDGWNLAVNGSLLHYRLVGADFAALHASGSSKTAGTELNYPLYRSQWAALNLGFAAEHKAFDNWSGGAITTHYAIDLASFNLNGSRTDDIGAGGRSSLGLNLAFGYLDLSDSPNRDADAMSTGSAGRFGKLRYWLSRQQALNRSLSLSLALSGQVANQNLDSAEKFYLGGAYGVRAYPSSEGGGSDGQMVNAELSSRLPYNATLSGFYDWGSVRVNKDNDFPGHPVLNRYALQGAGLGLGWAGDSGASVRATWARRIGDNPNPTTDGKDQDGTLIRDRFWLFAGWVF